MHCFRGKFLLDMGFSDCGSGHARLFGEKIIEIHCLALFSTAPEQIPERTHRNLSRQAISHQPPIMARLAGLFAPLHV